MPSGKFSCPPNAPGVPARQLEATVQTPKTPPPLTPLPQARSQVPSAAPACAARTSDKATIETAAMRLMRFRSTRAILAFVCPLRIGDDHQHRHQHLAPPIA